MSPAIFGLLIGLGATLGMWRISQSVPAHLALKSAGSSLLVLSGALVGARTGFLIWQPAVLDPSGWQALQIWKGGLNWPGALAGGLITLLILVLIQRKSFFVEMDRISYLLPPIAIMTWLACISEGCAFGAQLDSDLPWLMVADQRGVISARFPTQLMASAVLFLAFYLFERNFSNKRVGLRSALVWFIFSLHTLLFSFLRADLRPVWKQFPVDIWAAFLLTLLTVSYLLVVLLQRKPGRKAG